MRRTTTRAAIALCLAGAWLRAASADDARPPNASSPCGINLSGVADWSTEFPFVDVFRMSRDWVSNAEGHPWGQGGALDVDERGWVRQLAPGQFATTLLFTSAGFPAGHYVCLYDGEGEIRIEGQSVIHSAPGRIEIDVRDKPGLLLHLRRTDTANPVRNIRILMPGAESSAGPGPFAARFLERTAQFSVIRFMDWMSTNGSRQRHWADRPRPDDANQTAHGVCAELMIDLCNKAHADPWFCMPHLADDDYIRQFAILVRDRLDPERRIYIEHSKEVWNFGFPQARYAQEQGTRLKLADNDYQAALFYHARRSVEIFKIWEDVFGGHDRLVRVLGSHSANPWATEQIVSFQNAGRQADALAIAPYFGYALGDPRRADETARLSLDEVFERCHENIRRNADQIDEHARWAKRSSLDLIAYEGGQHLVGHGGAENNEALSQLFYAANRDPRMGDLYREDLESWKAHGGRLFAVFASTAGYSKWGSWGLLERDDQDPNTAPKLEAVQAFMRDHPRWWPARP